MNLVEQARQFGRQPRRLCRAMAVDRAWRATCLASSKLPAQRRDGRRRSATPVERFAPNRFEGDVVLVDVAQRRHLRQQQRPSAGSADEGQGQRPAGAAGRQEDPRGGEILGRIAQTGQQPRRQRVDERQARSNGVDVQSVDTRALA